MTERDILLDVSRLIWRTWKGRLPTGIDRACIAYLDRYAARSRAMIHWGARRFILSPAASDRLFSVLGRAKRKTLGVRSRAAIVWALARAVPGGWQGRDVGGVIYLNIGHTGLDALGLPDWLAAHGLKPVYLVHDLIPLTHPQFCRPGEANRHRARMRNLLISAQGVIANSAATLDDLAAFAALEGLTMPRAIVAWLGAEPVPSTAASNVPDRPYFLSIGTIEGRKNHAMLLRIWRDMARRGADPIAALVLVGQRGWQADEAFGLLDSGDFGSNVIELGHCDDAQMHALICGARAVLMPSFAEGFGIPVIEALQHGTPVIASDLAVFREIAGDIPLYLDPLDSGGWKRAVLAFAADNPQRALAAAAAAAYRAPTLDEHFVKVDTLLSAL